MSRNIGFTTKLKNQIDEEVLIYVVEEKASKQLFVCVGVCDSQLIVNNKTLTVVLIGVSVGISECTL